DMPNDPLSDIMPQTADSGLALPLDIKAGSCFTVPSIVAQAYDCFQQDLPALLLKYDRQWVAYHGTNRIGIAASQWELHEECLRRGYKDEELLLQCVMPEVTEIDQQEVA